MIINGKIIEERAVKWGDPVTVGKSNKATLQLDGDVIPVESRLLFEARGSKYYLCLDETVSGRLQIARERPAVALSEAGAIDGRVELAEGCRGKLSLHGVTILFSFENAAPEPERLVLPRELGGAFYRTIDPQFVGIFAFVAALQISVVAYARSVPFVEELTLEALSPGTARIIAPLRPLEPLRVEEPAKDPEPAKPAPVKEAKPSVTGDPARGGAQTAAERVSDRVSKRGLLGVLGKKSRAPGAIDDVFEEGAIIQSLGSAFDGARGVEIMRAGDNSRTRGVLGEESGVGIGVLGGHGTPSDGAVTAGEREETSLAGEGFVTPETPRVDGTLSESEIAGAMRVHVRALRACYESALKRNPKLGGKLVLRFEIDESGRAADFGFEDDSVRSGEVRECIARRAAHWRFPKPSGGTVFVEYPVLLTPAG